MSPATRSRLLPYGIAVLSNAVALLLTWLLQPLIAPTVFALFYPAVTLSALSGGWGPGLLATTLAASAAQYFFLAPIPSSTGQLTRLSLLVLVALMLCGLGSALRAAKQRAEQNLQKLRLSEGRYRRLLDTAHEGIWTRDAQECTNYVNSRMAELLGYRPEEMLGRPIFDFMDEAARQVAQQHVERRRQGVREQFEFCYRCKDGSALWALVCTNPILSEDGEFLGSLATVTDLTERKRFEQSQRLLLEASTLLSASLDYETLLNRVARLCISSLADGCVVDVLREEQTVCQVAVAHTDPLQEALLQEIRQRHPLLRQPTSKAGTGPPTGQSFGQSFGQSLLASELTDAQLATYAVDSQHLAMLRQLGPRSCMIVPLTVRDQVLGSIVLLVCKPGRHYSKADLSLAEELGRRAALAIDNAWLYREAQEANRIKDDFLATVAHELRSPLNAMLGWAQLLRRGTLKPAATARALETIERNARAQNKLIEDLLDISRIIRGKLKLQLGPISLLPVIEAALEAVRPSTETKHIRLESVLDPTVGSVSGDPDRLQQVIWNLLSNAVKFTPEGGSIEVRLEQTGQYARISVTDTGKGISPEFLPQVFDRFRQSDQTRQAHEGLGLGLAIVHHLVESQGGKVQATSPGEGQGATFTVILPLLSEAQAQPSNASKRTPPTRLPSLQGLRVLAVDDEADTREFLQVALTQCGAEVITVPCTREALNALEYLRPDVLISDIGMPGEDGYVLIRQIRARSTEQGGEIPAVALTAYARDEDRQKALAAGFQQHVPKPVEATTLITVVAAVVGRC